MAYGGEAHTTPPPKPDGDGPCTRWVLWKSIPAHDTPDANEFDTHNITISPIQSHDHPLSGLGDDGVGGNV